MSLHSDGALPAVRDPRVGGVASSLSVVTGPGDGELPPGSLLCSVQLFFRHQARRFDSEHLLMLLRLLLCPPAVFFAVAPVPSDLVLSRVCCAHLLISSENLLGMD